MSVEGFFQRATPNIEGNPLLREPQAEAYLALQRHYAAEGCTREVGIVLPVGCGKSGLIAIAPFALQAKRVLVIAPGLRISSQLMKDFSPAEPSTFYRKCKIVTNGDHLEPAEIRGKSSNSSDLHDADVVVTNIQQLQRDGVKNRWLRDLPDSFFDVILFDEGHHNVAESWEILRQKFPNARVVSASATPTRSDGRLMAGTIVYTYPIYRAIQKGFVKHVKGLVLNPSSLRYVRREDGNEVEVNLEEVQRLGASDAGFRRSIVSSKETLDTIVDASITEVRRLRDETGDRRLKVIASALNMEHCKQVVKAYEERGLRAAYIHSRESGRRNDDVLAKLDRHELDVIVQVRMLGEGFDHPHLSVAAVLSIFATLSPFVQFVGRIMRTIKQESPGDPVNSGTVVFHAGANTAKAWSDFKSFAEADQEWLELLTEQVPVDGGSATTVDPTLLMQARGDVGDAVDFLGRGVVTLEELPLLSREYLEGALRQLIDAGYDPADIASAATRLEPIPVTRQNRRRATKKWLDETVKTRAGKALGDRGLNFEGRSLDTKRLGRSNWLVVKSAIDTKLYTALGHGAGSRPDLTQVELDRAAEMLDDIVIEVESELFSG